MFVGHEGSVFGVQISKKLPSECCAPLRRVVASCSDDRTVRIWDVSDVTSSTTTTQDNSHEYNEARTRHTGFSNEAFDTSSYASSRCLAIGWGHISRVWTARFLETAPCSGSLLLQSAAEDATARIWELIPSSGNDGGLPYTLLQIDCAAHHSGKNLWSSAIRSGHIGLHQVVCGGADSKITAFPLPRKAQPVKPSSVTSSTEYTVDDVVALGHDVGPEAELNSPQSLPRTTKKTDFFRSYCFVDFNRFLLTTNTGKVSIGHLQSDVTSGQFGPLTRSTSIAQQEDLCGYSICTSEMSSGVAFVAGAKGNIYIHCNHTGGLQEIHQAHGKIGEMRAISISGSSSRDTVGLLVTILGRKEALFLNVSIEAHPKVCRSVAVPISETLTGSVITSMAYTNTSADEFIFVGFRRGSIVVYSVESGETETDQATLFKFVNNAHDDETVTCLSWKPSLNEPSQGHLLSVGRDGCLAIHQIDLATDHIELVHRLALPIGPSIEGLYFHERNLLVHGFSSKKWVLYNVTTEEEVMNVETGGAHRSWAYQPHKGQQGGTIVWSRASSMHIRHQVGPGHSVIRSGGHGREIKAVAISPASGSHLHDRLIATGSEDTDIKIFQYVDGDLVCRRTLRKHTTGIQHLQWSEDGGYLFSSGGCEECTYITLIMQSSSYDLHLLIRCCLKSTSGASANCPVS